MADEAYLSADGLVFIRVTLDDGKIHVGPDGNRPGGETSDAERIGHHFKRWVAAYMAGLPKPSDGDKK